MEYTVRRTGRTWSVFKGAELIEGGFFSRAAAEATAEVERSGRASAGRPARQLYRDHACTHTAGICDRLVCDKE